MRTFAGREDVLRTGCGKMIGTCRLCRADGELRDSHIMPRWVFRRIIHFGPDPQPILIENGTRRSTGDQDTEYLLCESCEQRFGRWENDVSQLALQLDDSFPAFEALTIRGHREPDKETEANGAAPSLPTCVRPAPPRSFV